MGDAIAYLLMGAMGVLTVRYGERAVTVMQRLNRATYRRLPPAFGGVIRCLDALHGFMTVMVVGWGYVCIVAGVVGLIYSLS